MNKMTMNHYHCVCFHSFTILADGRISTLVVCFSHL